MLDYFVSVNSTAPEVEQVLTELCKLFKLHGSKLLPQEEVIIHCYNNAEMSESWEKMLTGKEDEVAERELWKELMQTIGPRYPRPKFAPSPFL